MSLIFNVLVALLEENAAGPARTGTSGAPPAERPPPKNPVKTPQTEAALLEARDWFRQNEGATDEEYLDWTRLHVAALLHGYGWWEAREMLPPEDHTGPGVRALPPHLTALVEDTHRGLIEGHEQHRRARAHQLGA